ncbi:MAG: hypothetical protein HY026_05805 [Deltaproteobacteria bacterium]|nr:hypothetical protein [Deltaproteobacteria bacterium]
MPRTNIIFDIYSPEEFFYSINTAWENYKKGKQKSVEILLYVIMGLNHLREWIAPGYNPEKKLWKTPSTDAESFSKAIYNDVSFEIIRDLCNRTKHLKQMEAKTSSDHDVSFDDWSDIDAVRNWDKGPASAYSIDVIDVINIIDKVIDFYQIEWFKKKGIVFK